MPVASPGLHRLQQQAAGWLSLTNRIPLIGVAVRRCVNSLCLYNSTLGEYCITFDLSFDAKSSRDDCVSVSRTYIHYFDVKFELFIHSVVLLARCMIRVGSISNCQFQHYNETIVDKLL